MKLTAKNIGLVGGIVLFVIALFFNIDPQKPQLTYMLAIAILMAVWWLTEAVPIAVTSLLPLFMFPLFGIMDGKTTASWYTNDIIFLFLGGFIVALAMQKWNLHKRLAIKIVKVFGVSQGKILIGFMSASAFLSMWMSNTATTMMMVPIVMSVVIQLEEVAGKDSVGNYATGLFLGLAYAASIGGTATLVGTPPNLVFAQIFKITFPQGPEISFSDWMIFALPTSIIMFFIAFVILYYRYKPKTQWNIKKELFTATEKQLGPTTYEEKIIGILFAVMGLLWIFRKNLVIGSIHIPGWSNIFAHPEYFKDGTVAIFIASLLFLLPSRTKKGEKIIDWQISKDIPWGIILLFGGGFALANGFVKSGLSLWFANSLSFATNMPPFLMVLTVSVFISLLTQLTSNTATTQILLPVLSGVAIAAKINPLMLMIPATMSASLAFMTPVATPPNAIVFGTERIKMKDMLVTGTILTIIGVIVISLMAYFVAESLLHLNFSTLPNWAVISK